MNKRSMKLSVGCFQLLTIFLLLMPSMPSLAEESPKVGTGEEKKTEDSKPQDKKDLEIGIWEGFRGVKWGSKIETLTGFNKVGSDDSLSFYVRDNDQMTIGGAQLQAVLYVFSDGELANVMLTTKGKTNSDALKKALTARFGEPIQENPYLDNYKWLHNPLSAGGVVISLEYDMFSNDGKCQFYHCAAVMKSLKKEEKKAQDGAKKDF